LGAEAPILQLDNVGAAYGRVRILEAISFSLEQGKSMAVLGANGAGKTTLLRAISGLAVRRSGTIRFDKTSIDQLPAFRIARLGIGLVPEGRHLFGPLSVDDNLEVGAFARPKRQSKTATDETRDLIFALFPRLAERRCQAAKTLSGGEQQMLAIARALMAQPRFLMLDEPSIGLAPKIIEDLFAALHRLKQTGLTILLAEQHVPLALDLADVGILLHLGRAVLQGGREMLRASPDVKRVYLGG
jgi:branched-chain amino acid transport system ATP-binding protein